MAFKTLLSSFIEQDSIYENIVLWGERPMTCCYQNLTLSDALCASLFQKLRPEN